MEENKKSVVDQVKELLFSSEKVNNVEEFAEVKTSEGVILNISAMEVGATIEVVSEDGKNPAPAGEYILEDGSTIVVGEEGVISEVKVAEEEVAEEEMSEETVDESKDSIDADVSEEEVNPLEARIEALEAKFSALSDVNILLAEKNVELEGKNDVLESKFSAFKGEPAAKEIKITKKDAKYDKFAALGSVRRNKK